MTDEQFRLLRQESDHHIRLGSTHQQKRKGGIIHDTTPAEVKHEAGAKVRRSRHVMFMFMMNERIILDET